MTVRRRIFLAALAVGVVGTLVVLLWSAGPKDTEPKLEFTLLGYTNGVVKEAIIGITNCEPSGIALHFAEVQFDEEPIHGPDPAFLANHSIDGHSFRVESVSLTESPGVGTPTARWRVQFVVTRRTLSNALRWKLKKLPLIGHHIDAPRIYHVTSDWFEQ